MVEAGYLVDGAARPQPSLDCDLGYRQRNPRIGGGSGPGDREAISRSGALARQYTSAYAGVSRHHHRAERGSGLFAVGHYRIQLQPDPELRGGPQRVAITNHVDDRVASSESVSVVANLKGQPVCTR